MTPTKGTKVAKAKIPARDSTSNLTVLEYVFARAARKWPELVAQNALGFTGMDPKTGDLYFQQWGNPEPFIIREDRGDV